MTTRAPASKSAEFGDYPFLTADEFTEVCNQLDRIYRHATLGPLRRRWRLSACTAFNTSSYAAGSEYTTYLQITRPLDEDAAAALDDSDLSSQLDRFSLGTLAVSSADVDVEEDQAMAEDDEADQVSRQYKRRTGRTSTFAHTTQAVLRKQPPATRPADVGFVTYEIHLHPTYRAPCLWFSLHGLPEYEPAFSIDTVFRRLVPDSFKDGLRVAGSIGGISADYHPITGVPSFFVHPCLLGEAMSGFDCSKSSYLMVWIGLVGGCVGLWVPKELALIQDCFET
ncbi:hypothetical protein CMQ_6051 [Grosmannia clavigera kw1407]|uniref:Ubiquitin-like-conjugating enzyme ATG10 n=1 Tax=Grosmannia clavigera (strain kw1407 / UAMH 11150) TaxID=655863 RepID=F0XLJ2_GROCL|nr:uncharacterized protein CMQ_6051 [Grosmannia clavigera kw1407]EFX01109.1 hypothetical protein CMQ_6051 [Grosmannia clavigera kw1407]